MNLHRTTRAGIGAILAASSLAGISLVVPFGASPAAATSNCQASDIPSSGTTDITYMEGMTAANETEQAKLVAAFNASQSQVHVNLVDESGGYVTTWDTYLKDIGKSSEPNVVMLDQYITQGAVDSQSIVPVATCIAGTSYSTSTFTPRVLGEETVISSLQGMPYSVSAPILIYNQNAFTKAKIKTAPTTLSEMASDAAALKKAGYSDGMTISIDPWFLQVWEGIGNQYFVNNANGRTGRATEATFDNPIGKTILTDLQNIVKHKDAVTNPDSGSLTQAYGNLYAIGGGQSGMTIDSSATLGTILSLLPKFPKVKLGVAEMPLITPKSSGGVEPGGNALFLPSYPNESAAKLAASWEFIEYLVNAQNMAAWDAASGYVPIRSDAATNSKMVAFWKKYPQLKAAYNELSAGVNDNATYGPLIGPYYTVEGGTGTTDNLTYYMTELFSPSFPSPSSILSKAAKTATSQLKAYNKTI